MRRSNMAMLLATGLTAAAVAPAPGQASATEEMRTVAAKAITWSDANVPGFAPGMKMAVIQGNPAEAGPYTLRLSFPSGYRFPAHWHPMAENLTVLSGTFQLATGDRVDDSKLKVYAAGDYVFMPATMPHFGSVRGLTVVQLHGEGPFKINLAGSAAK